MHLERIFADNFRCLVNFELKTVPVQVLVGGNGSGKSTVLDMLALLRSFVSDGVNCSAIFGGKTKTRWQSVAKQRFELDVSDDGRLYRYALVIAEDQKKQTRVEQETLDFEGRPLFQFIDGEMRLFNDRQNPQPSVTFHADWSHSGLGIVSPRPDNSKLSAFKEWLDRLHPVQINPWDMSEQSESEARHPAPDLENLADWYRHLVLENGDAVYAAIEDLRIAIPGLSSISAKQAGREYREIIASLKAPDGGQVEVALTELSEGQRCLIALYLLLHAQLSNGATLVIDEPENFISLREIQPWLFKAIDKAEECGGQLIVASHHPEVLNQLVARGATLLVRPDGGATRVKPFPFTADLTPAEVVANGWENG
jgi:predicted ATPase